MNSIVILASALFFNAANPADVVPAVSQVGDLQECAQVVNDARKGVTTEDGVTYFPTNSRCTAVEVNENGEPVDGFDPETLFN